MAGNLESESWGMPKLGEWRQEAIKTEDSAITNPVPD
jgi:hypothetical protein